MEGFTYSLSSHGPSRSALITSLSQVVACSVVNDDQETPFKLIRWVLELDMYEYKYKDNIQTPQKQSLDRRRGKE